MDQQELRSLEGRCTQEEPAACRAGCPLGVDGRSFAAAMARQDFAGARAILDKSMPLVGIIGRLCEAPCENFCLRQNFGGSIALGALERFCLGTVPARGKMLRLPLRPQKVSIIGSGPSSLTAAFDLAKKGYPVTLLHPVDGPGGWLRHLPETLLPPTILQEELARLVTLGVEFLPVAVLDRQMYDACKTDACYIGQDDQLAPDLLPGLENPNPETFALATPGLFTGGLCPTDHPHRLITDVSQGREAATSIDRFLQGASLTAGRIPLRHGQTTLHTETKDVVVKERIIPTDPAGYTSDEAAAEAERCLDCQCLECVKHCLYLAEYGAYPKAYARRVYNNSAIVKGIHQANRFINSCTLCRQCETLCPNDFSMADLCLTARQLMVRENRMPASAHWFALEEMRAAGGETALARHAPGTSESRTVFFPGCQLAGIRPEQSLRLYDHLRRHAPQTGIWLDCCGAPADWAGRVDELAEIGERLRTIWKEMGQPRVVIACSTCLQMFRRHLPEIRVASLWTEIDATALPTARTRPPLALSDPCTARHDTPTQQAVRTLLAAMGQELAPLAMAGELTECCGFGGLLENADPILAEKVRTARVAQTDAPFLTYCAMCRDQLARTGKPVLHLLDLLFADIAHGAEEPPASLSARRANRRMLQHTIATRCGEVAGKKREPWQDIIIHISPAAEALLQKRRILDDDIRRVLHQATMGGSSFCHGGDSKRLASARLGPVTFWVEYRILEGVFHIDRCWSHRMTIHPGGAA
jgi:Fe-S oxidoreductase